MCPFCPLDLLQTSLPTAHWFSRGLQLNTSAPYPPLPHFFHFDPQREQLSSCQGVLSRPALQSSGCEESSAPPTCKYLRQGQSQEALVTATSLHQVILGETVCSLSSLRILYLPIPHLFILQPPWKPPEPSLHPHEGLSQCPGIFSSVSGKTVLAWPSLRFFVLSPEDKASLPDLVGDGEGGSHILGHHLDCSRFRWLVSHLGKIAEEP